MTSASGAVIDDAMVALGLSSAMKTDPAVVRDILSAMKVDDLHTSCPPMREFLDQVVSRPLGLGRLLAQVRWGLSVNAPAVVEFLDEALRRGWLSPSPSVDKAVHVAFVLEGITAAMCNSPVFFDDYVRHVRTKQRDIGIDHEHVVRSFFKMLPGSLDFFGTAKAVSLDMAMVYFRVGPHLAGGGDAQQTLDELLASGSITRLERKLLLPLCVRGHCVCNDWLRINIYEAGITEHKSGFEDNAIAAHVLAEHVHRRCHRESFQRRHVQPEGPTHPFYRALEDEDGFFPVIDIGDQWKSLYLSWNMAFILGELNNLHYLFPKLLIPSVLCSRSENFLGARIVSLWVSINSALLLNFHRVEKLKGPARRREMAQVWGGINRQHAEALYEADIDPDLATLTAGCRSRYDRPYTQLGKQVMDFMKR